MKPHPIQVRISGPATLWARLDTMPNPASYVAPTSRAKRRPGGISRWPVRSAWLRGRLPSAARAGSLVLHTLSALEGIRAGLRRTVPQRHRPVRHGEPRHPGFPGNGVQPTSKHF